MKTPAVKPIKRKEYLKIKDVEQLYRVIYKYKLRNTSYIKLLKYYLEYYK